MKGKYAAKAANRTANLDNDLLQAAFAERDTAQMECDRLRLEVQAAERILYSRAMQLGGEMAAKDVAAARAETNSAQNAADELRSAFAEFLVDHFNKLRTELERLGVVDEAKWIPPGLIDGTLGQKLGFNMAEMITTIMPGKTAWTQSRADRRTRPKRMKALADYQRQIKGGSGPLSV